MAGAQVQRVEVAGDVSPEVLCRRSEPSGITRKVGACGLEGRPEAGFKGGGSASNGAPNDWDGRRNRSLVGDNGQP